MFVSRTSGICRARRALFAGAAWSSESVVLYELHEGGLSGGTRQQHGGHPVVVRCEFGCVPPVRMLARIELFLQSAQKPAFGLGRGMSSVHQALPGVIRNDSQRFVLAMW